ncbi:MAG TPA: circadian clock KaiB family protein [Gemmatimonadaceae bacterium]|nr:circadian clock KaiB family protein [Gemmatimonadaceae bacterium]
MAGVVVLRLYLAGEGPNSTTARLNLERLLAGVDHAGYSLEVVDCLRDPLRALEQGVLVTPTLVRVEPEPVVTIIGTLRDSRGVMDMLGLARAVGVAAAEGARHDGP